MIEWLIYNSFIPLLPVPLVLLGAWLVGAKKSLLSVIGDGQLCFYCTAISAVALHDIFTANNIKTIQNTGIAIAGMVFCIILSTFSYGITVTANTNENTKFAIISIFSSITTTILVLTTRYYLGIL
jgi:hypothetical protein